MKPTVPTISCDIHGVFIEVEVNDSALHGWLSDYLGPYLVDSVSEPCVRFSFRVRPDEPMRIPEGAEWFLHYDGLAGLTHEGMFYFEAMGSVMRFDPESGRVEGTFTEALLCHQRYLTHLVFTVALFETLRYHGLYYIHSAAVVGPARERLLIPANGSSGKTTLCVALLYHGYKYVSDDAVFARWIGGKVELAPFKRKFHVSPRLGEVFDELKFLESEPEYFPGNDKRAIDCEDIFPGRFVPRMEAPHVILFPEIVDDPVSSLVHITSQKALTKMIPNSALVMFSRPAAKSHLEALREIVCSSRCYTLLSGRDVYDDPREAVGRILRELKL